MVFQRRAACAVRRIPAAVIFACFALVVAGCDDQGDTDSADIARPVISIKVADLEPFETALFTGEARALNEVNIGFEVRGRLLTRPVDVGSVVRAGDVLATLEPDTYLARVRALEGERAALEARLENAAKELRRQEQLRDRDVSSQARVDDQQMVVSAVEAQLRANEGALDAARINVGYTTLRAPFDGTVSAIYLENFQNVAAKQPVLRLLDTSRIEMEVNVPEGLLAYRGYLERIDVTFASVPGVTLQAEVSEVGSEATATTRTYPVTVVMDQPEGARVLPGMVGAAKAILSLPDDWSVRGVRLPAAAVLGRDGDGDAAVWVVDEASGTVARKQVGVVSAGAEHVEVSGLTAGDRVVIAGARVLTEGQRVRVTP